MFVKKRKYGLYVIFAHILTGIFVLFEVIDFIPLFKVKLEIIFMFAVIIWLLIQVILDF
jgi:hypothetical protein